MRPIKRIALYLRVSTQDQSTELQYGELLKYIEARGLPAPTIYQDKSTGTNGNRPAFKQLMTDIRLRKVDLVICWKLDRLFRSLKDLIATLQEYNELGVEFISLKDNIDMTTSAGRQAHAPHNWGLRRIRSLPNKRARACGTCQRQGTWSHRWASDD
jgi:DNA invertase Pin-like site-specific DNA recombinase